MSVCHGSVDVCMLELAWQKALKPLPIIESKVTSVIVSERHRWNRELGIGISTFTSSTLVYCSLVYCKYTTWIFLSPESYSLNVRVGNRQLPNYLHSSEDTDKFHRPEKKNEDQFNVRIEGTAVPSCKMPRGRLPFVAQE